MRVLNLSAERRVVLLLIVLGLLGGGLVLAATSGGIGANGDSAAYLLAARNVLAGQGLVSFTTSGPSDMLTAPLSHWPPLFPLLLAALGLTGLDPAIGARLLNAALFAVNVGLVGWLVWRLAGTGLAVGVAVLLMLGAPHILVLHSMAWTEPLFLTLTLATLILLAHALTGGGRRTLFAAALAAAAACQTRYVGLALLGLGGLALWLWPGRRLARRIGEGVVFGVLGVLPTARVDAE